MTTPPIILILVLLKLLSENGEVRSVKSKEFQSFKKEHFNDSENIKNVINRVKSNKVTEIINFLQKNTKYFESFNKMDLEDFLNARIRIQINLINYIIEDLDSDLDTYRVGTLIAEANNDTQNVKADDIFGNKYKKELNEKVFKDFSNLYQDKVEIEFRLGEIAEKVKKVHILTLLRQVVATGILTRENDISEFTNQRVPIYRLFEKLLSKGNVENTISAISKLVPFLYKIRVEYVEPYLESYRRSFTREYKEKAIKGDLDDTIIKLEVNSLKNNDPELEKLIRKSIRYNIEHIMPVLIFRIRKLFTEKKNGQLDLTIPEENKASFFKGLIEAIYEKYIGMRLGGLPSSLTTAVRDKKFYEYGRETYIAFKNAWKLEETDYITRNTHIIR